MRFHSRTALTACLARAISLRAQQLAPRQPLSKRECRLALFASYEACSECRPAMCSCFVFSVSPVCRFRPMRPSSFSPTDSYHTETTGAGGGFRGARNFWAYICSTLLRICSRIAATESMSRVSNPGTVEPVSSSSDSESTEYQRPATKFGRRLAATYARRVRGRATTGWSTSRRD